MKPYPQTSFDKDRPSSGEPASVPIHALTPRPFTVDIDERPLGSFLVHVDSDYAGEYLRRGVDGPDALYEHVQAIIEQAPVMLALLERIRDQYNHDDRMGGLGDYIEDVIAAARKPVQTPSAIPCEGDGE